MAVASSDQLHSDITHCIGNTPLVKLNRIAEGWEPAQLKNAVLVTWEALLEAGWQQDAPESDETYGQEYSVDGLDLRWLQERLEAKDVWREDDKGNAMPISSAQMEAIANLMLAIEEAMEK